MNSLATKVFIEYADGEARSALLPDGYHRVLCGGVRPTDLCYDRETESWVSVSEMGCGLTRAFYGCVVREGAQPHEPCANCGANAVGRGGELCENCREIDETMINFHMVDAEQLGVAVDVPICVGRQPSTV
jgi:hypothetical protein